MIKAIDTASLVAIPTSILFVTIGAFISFHVLVTSLIALSISVCARGIASNLKQ